MKNVVVVEYDPEWPEVFERLRATIWSAVSDVALTIEHVGSTAVPGLAAKPVIDLDVVVPDDAVPVAIARLARIGYRHRGDLGIPGREAFRHDLAIPHHVYVCPRSSAALGNHLAVRDHLRTDDEAAAAYGALKRRLAEQFPHDMDGYVAGKTHFLVDLLRSLGFQPDALDAIERMNRRPS